MTEKEWLICNDSRRMVRPLLSTQPKPSTRRLRLFAVACCRRVWDLIPTEEARHLVEVLELYLERSAKWRDVLEQRKAADRVYGLHYTAWVTGNGNTAPYAWAAHQAAGQTPDQIMLAAECAKGRPYGRHLGNTGNDPEQAHLLRDIFGNPFRPVVFAAEWRSDTSVSLAKHIYENCDFAQMSILADALQDAGCDNVDILSHCRDPQQTHVRGCWVVDLVLGKE